MKLQGGRFRTLLGGLHIFALARNMISLRKLDDVGEKNSVRKGYLQDGLGGTGIDVGSSNWNSIQAAR